jgi:hypothetical protein
VFGAVYLLNLGSRECSRAANVAGVKAFAPENVLVTAMFVAASILLFVVGATRAARIRRGDTRRKGRTWEGPALLFILFRRLLLAAHRPNRYAVIVM